MKLHNFVMLVAFPAAVWAQTPATAPDPQAPLTAGQKTALAAKSMIDPMSLAGVAISSGLNQWRDVPHQWGQGMEGYGTRFASAEGYNVANNSIALGLRLTMHLDPRYRRMPEAGAGARIKNALAQVVIANKDAGGTMFNVPSIAGCYGAAFIGNTWQPGLENRPSDALVRGTLTLAFHAGKNVAHEFLPDLLRRFKHGQPAQAGKTAGQ